MMSPNGEDVHMLHAELTHCNDGIDVIDTIELESPSF